MYIPNKKLLSNSKYNSCRNFNGTFKECSRNSVSLVEKYWDRVWRNIKRTSRPATRSFSCRREVAIWQRHAAILKLSLPDRSFLACHSRDLLVFWSYFTSPEKARLFVYTRFISWSNSISILENIFLLSSEIHRLILPNELRTKSMFIITYFELITRLYISLARLSSTIHLLKIILR